MNECIVDIAYVSILCGNNCSGPVDRLIMRPVCSCTVYSNLALAIISLSVVIW